MSFYRIAMISHSVSVMTQKRAVVIDFGEPCDGRVIAQKDLIRFLDRREKEIGEERLFRGRSFGATDRCAGGLLALWAGVEREQTG